MELRKRLNYRELRQNKNRNIKVKDVERDDRLSSDSSCILPFSNLSISEQEIYVNIRQSRQCHAPKPDEQEKRVSCIKGLLSREM